MCVAKCIIIAYALSLGVVSSWDIAITTGDQLEFYTNKTKEKDEVGRFRDLTALAHDAIHNLLLFVDKQGDNASIFSYNLATKKSQPLVGRRSHESIQGLTFEPISGKIFWSDTRDKSIYTTSLLSRSKTDIYGKVLLNMTHEIPRGIAVDSCRGYIYWTNINHTRPTIERARLDGSDRQVIIDKDIYMPVSIAVDQRTKRLYWADDTVGIHYTIESSDLDGGNRKKIVVGIYHQPNSLTVSKDSLYWVDWAFKTVWKIDKDAPPFTEPEEFLTFSNVYNKPFGLVANYNVKDQFEGIPECTNVWSFSQMPKINDTFDIPTNSIFDVGLFCLHGEGSGDKCKCMQGYTGDRCEMSVCQNFCLNGDCEVGSDGQPTCRCKTGFAGLRCEVNVCTGFCLNIGDCSISSGKPICKCPDNFDGDRCEVKKVEPVTTSPVTEKCDCTNNVNMPVTTEVSLPSTESLGDDYVDSCAGWDGVRDPILMVLGVLCGLLSLLCAILATKVLQLKRRPRIKKRIIVNKNVTPLTARPDQCEISIENCCNMNICETPCFEPKSTIRPNLLNTKQGKEEKRNLIGNMENPDDMY